MRFKRWGSTALCIVIGGFAVAAATAQASPEWWVRHEGTPTSPAAEVLPGSEILNSQGVLTVERTPEKPFKCLAKGHELAENKLAIGQGAVETFEGICEKGAPYPCAAFEPAEFFATTTWPSTLVKPTSANKVFDNFGLVEIEFRCLDFTGHAIYKSVAGSEFKPEFKTGILKFGGASSGELEISPFTAGVPHLKYKGTYYTSPSSPTYKLVRWK
jgi:hypothetical protein